MANFLSQISANKPKTTTGTPSGKYTSKEDRDRQYKLQQQEQQRLAASYSRDAPSNQYDLQGGWQSLQAKDAEAELRNANATNPFAPGGSRYTPPSLKDTIKPKNLSGGGGSGGGSSGGGGGIGAVVEAPAPPVGVIDPSLLALVPTTAQLEAMYGNLSKSFAENKANLDKDYQASIDRIKGNYANSNNLIQQSITGDEASLAAAAKAMGVNDWSTGATSQGNTDFLNDLLAGSATNQTTDLSWFEKMRNLDAGQLDNMLNLAGLQRQDAIQSANNTMLQLQQMANQEALAASLGGGGSGGGGGGGGGRRGYGGGYGGGGSGKSPYLTDSETAAETMDRKNIIVSDAINGIMQSNPELGLWAWNQWSHSGGDTTKAMANIFDQLDAYKDPEALKVYNPLAKNANSLFNNAFGQLFGSKDYVPTYKPLTGPSADRANWEWLLNVMLQADETSGTSVNQSYDTKTTQSSKTNVPTTVPQNWAANKGLSGLGASLGLNKPKVPTPPPQKPKSTYAPPPKKKKPPKALTNSLKKFF